MSIATQIARIQQARNAIRNKLVSLGLAETNDDLDVLAGKINEIVDNGNISESVKEGETYTIPAGFHSGSGTVSGIAGEGNYNLQSKTVTPTKQQQTITPDEGYFGLSDVVVSPIPEAYQDITSVTAGATDVLEGKRIVDASGNSVEGAMANNGDVSASIDGIEKTSVTIPAGYNSGGTIELSSDIEEELSEI